MPEVVHRFKTMTTHRYAAAVAQAGWPPFAARLWQRNYFEHVVRDETSLARLRRYVDGNPARWALDEDNPARARPW